MKTTSGFFVADRSNIYKNGKQISQAYYFKGLTKRQYRKLEKILKDYLNSLTKVP